MSTLPTPVAIATPTVGTTPVQVAGPNSTRLGLYVFNPSATVTLWITAVPAAPSVGGNGCIAIQPSQGLFLGPPNMPPWTAGINGIAGSLGNVIAVLEFAAQGEQR
jgi:hypothetical protein